MNPILQIEQSFSLVFFLLTISLFLVGVLRAYYWKHTKLLFLASLKYRYASQYLRQDNVFTERVNWLTFAVLFINFPLLFLINSPDFELKDFVYVSLLIITFYLFKYLIVKFLGSLLFIKDITRLTVFFSYLSDKSFAITLTPFILISYYFRFDVSSLTLPFIFILGACFYVFKSFWMLRIGRNSFGLSSIYIFLYLCILEIYPFVFFTKGFFY